MKSEKKKIELDIDYSAIKTHKDYQDCWNKLDRLEIKMVKKDGECRHREGDAFFYDSPYMRPQGVCPALLHVIDLYTWRSVLGFPSWNSDDRKVFRLHCPDPEGTVWELRRMPKEE
ncbi:MAG: TIGR04076 family protein [Spirochaetales bacterium]|nr:TIGR04076 family protein [Spirochaetales bacterium]